MTDREKDLILSRSGELREEDAALREQYRREIRIGIEGLPAADLRVIVGFLAALRLGTQN